VLRAWLDENGYQIPESVDETLEPYIEMGNVFVALKLLPGTDAGDVQPLHLRFTSDTPAIPIVPTRVAANPDMGVIVHVLAGERAIPTNYAHVHVNEATIDWVNQGANYADVVSAAADEAAQGRAWVTDSAGPSEGIVGAIQPYPAELVEAVRAARTLGDLTSVLPSPTPTCSAWWVASSRSPRACSPTSTSSAPSASEKSTTPRPSTAPSSPSALTTEVNAPREALLALFANNDTLTRLYTTMSPEEMTQDPIFATNPDLNPVDRQRTATSYIFCDDQGRTVPALSYVETPSGLRFQLDENGQVPDVIQRQAGEDASAAEKGSESGGLPRLSAAEAGPVARSLWRLRTACDPPLAGRELRSATARSDAATREMPGRRAQALSVGEAQLVVTQIEGIALFHPLVLDALAVELDAVGGIEVFDVPAAAPEDHGAVLAGDVAVADGEIGLLAAATDDELLAVDAVPLPIEEQVERGPGGRSGIGAGLHTRLSAGLHTGLSTWLHAGLGAWLHAGRGRGLLGGGRRRGPALGLGLGRGRRVAERVVAGRLLGGEVGRRRWRLGLPPPGPGCSCDCGRSAAWPR
jgi:hypothetical protein